MVCAGPDIDCTFWKLCTKTSGISGLKTSSLLRLRQISEQKHPISNMLPLEGISTETNCYRVTLSGDFKVNKQPRCKIRFDQSSPVCSMFSRNEKRGSTSQVNWNQATPREKLRSFQCPFSFSCFRACGRGGSRGGSHLLKPTKATLFTMILYNSENRIRVRPFCRPLFCQSSAVKYASSLLQQWTRNDTSLPNITEIAAPNLAGWIRPWSASRSELGNILWCVVGK